MSRKGSSVIPTRSARFPASIVPTSRSMPRARAPLAVSAWRTAIGDMPALTMYSSSRAFSPCGPSTVPVQSVPMAILTPC